MFYRATSKQCKCLKRATPNSIGVGPIKDTSVGVTKEKHAVCCKSFTAIH